MAAHLGTAMLLLGLLLWLCFKARSEAAVEADQPVRAPVRGLKPYAVTAAVLLLCAIVAGGYMAGTEERGVNEVGPNIAGRPSRLRPPVPDLRRRQVPALREQPPDRHPPHPSGLRLRGDARDHSAAQRRVRPGLARPSAPAGGVAARGAGAARRHERLARRARRSHRRPPHGRDTALGDGRLDRLPPRLAAQSRALEGARATGRSIGGAGVSVHLGTRREHAGPQTRPGGGHVSVTPSDARARTMRAAILPPPPRGPVGRSCRRGRPPRPRRPAATTTCT